MWAAMSRVLAVRPDNLGDVILLTPALRALRAAAPRAHLDLLASPAGSAAAPLIPEVDRVLTLNPVWQDARGELPVDAARELALVARLRGYDAVVVFTSFAQSPWPAGYLAYLAEVPVRVGQSKEFGGSVLSHPVPPPPDDLHQVDRALHLLAGVGVPAVGTELSVRVPVAVGPAVTGVLHRAGVDPDAPYAVVAPGASAAARRYAPGRYAATAGLLAHAGLPVVVVGTAREADLVEVVAGEAGCPLAGALDVPGLAGLLDRAAVLVTNNSGSMHLAEALGTPLVVLFAGTELPAQYAPRHAPAVLLRQPTACTPCRSFTCRYQHECLDITPEQVAAAALRLAQAQAAA